MGRPDRDGSEAAGAVRLARHRRKGTAVSEKGRARSEAILDAAADVLAEEGYAALSTRRIAARAGIRLGNLQYYFAAKQDVVRALLERYLARSIASLEQRLELTAGTPGGRLRSCIEALLEAQERDGDCRMFREIWALAARDRSVARAADAFYQRYREGVAQRIREAAPRLGAPRVGRRATLLVAMLEGLLVFRLAAGRSEIPHAALAGEITSLILQRSQEVRP